MDCWCVQMEKNVFIYEVVLGKREREQERMKHER